MAAIPSPPMLARTALVLGVAHENPIGFGRGLTFRDIRAEPAIAEWGFQVRAGGP